MATTHLLFLAALIAVCAGCAADATPPTTLPASCDPNPSYSCPACSVHSCEPGLWATSTGAEFRCTPYGEPASGFPNLSCYDAQLRAAESCGC